MSERLIGLLLGTEEDWPAAFEALVARLGPVDGHRLLTERIVNEPFDLRYRPRYALVIDRLAWWYDLPRARYDESGERMMHLQTALEDFDVFVRSLSIGAETMSMWFDPSKPMHDRYQVRHDFLTPGLGDEIVSISRLVNAFFRWEFNSCETIVKEGIAYPIDYANASPDVALTSLHYYFPWAIIALVRWSAFCAVTERPTRVGQDYREYFGVGDREDLSYEEKLAAYRQLSDDYFQVDVYREFCDRHLAHVDELAYTWFTSQELDDLLVHMVVTTFPQHEHEHF